MIGTLIQRLVGTAFISALMVAASAGWSQRADANEGAYRLKRVKNLICRNNGNARARRGLVKDYVASFTELTAFPPYTEVFSNSTEAEAYDFQEEYVAALIDGGEVLSGYKLGFTGLGPRPLGATRPVYGRLFESLEFPNGGSASISENFAAGAQGIELAVRFSKDALFKTSDFPLSEDEVLSLIDAVAPAFENPDISFSGPFNFLDLIAQNTASRFVVLGDFVSIDSIPDIDDIPVTVTLNGEVVLQGSTADALGSQLTAVQFLLQQLAEEEIPVRKGEILVTGSLGGDLDLTAGTFVADFGGVGQVSFTFTE